MTRDVLLIVLVALIVVAAALVVFLVVYIATTIYLPTSRRWRDQARSSTHTVYRFADREHITDHGDGTVTIEPRTVPFRHMPVGGWRTRLCFYYEHRRRGGRINSKMPGGERRLQDLVCIPAPAFFEAYAGKELRYRRPDGAIVVRDAYTGPAVILRDLDHLAVRSQLTPPDQAPSAP